MTAIIGILCKDGVVIGADSAATFALPNDFRTVVQPIKKIRILGETLVSSTGSVGLAQRFCAVVEASRATSKHKSLTPIEYGKHLSSEMLKDMASTHLSVVGIGSLVGWYKDGSFHLCEFDGKQFQPELKLASEIWFASMGCGQPITDPFLGFLGPILWPKEPPDLAEGVLAAAWALKHACRINPGGIAEPITIAVLERHQDKPRARVLSDSELGEHLQKIADIETAIKHCAFAQAKPGANPTPAIPDGPK